MEPLVIYGEVLFDCFPDGRRILGGAPFNVAWGLQGMGDAPCLVSAVGEDEDGKAILDAMTAWGMRTDGVQVLPDLATGTVEVSFHDGEPSYAIPAPRAWDAIPDPGIDTCHILYHGSLAARTETSRETLATLCETCDGLRFFDVNLRPPHTSPDRVADLAQGADWLKLNIDELSMLTGITGLSFPSEEAEAAVQTLRETFEVANVLLTGGGDGAMVLGEAGRAIQSPAPPKPVFEDAVGAGDAVSAAFLHGLLHGHHPDTLLHHAGRFAARVCGLRGATTTHPEFYTNV